MLQTNQNIIEPAALMEKVRRNVLEIQIRDEQQETSQISFSSDISVSLQDLIEMQENLSSMQENIQIMNRSWFHADAQIQSNRRIVGWFLTIIKRAIRKTVYWFTQPYFERQNTFNEAVSHALSDSLNVQRMLIDTLKKQE